MFTLAASMPALSREAVSPTFPSFERPSPALLRDSSARASGAAMVPVTLAVADAFPRRRPSCRFPLNSFARSVESSSTRADTGSLDSATLPRASALVETSRPPSSLSRGLPRADVSMRARRCSPSASRFRTVERSGMGS